MPIDGYGRKIDYLRISVTDRCNLRCIYCMPQDGIAQKDPSEMLTFEEIIRITKLCASTGISKIKISGGEPLVRRNLLLLLKLLINLDNIKNISLTTNGILLKKYAKGLKEAGLKRINISIDTLDADKFRRIARTGELCDVLDGIDAAIDENFFVKLNVVLLKGINDDEILEFVNFAHKKRIIVRFIELMPMVDNDASDRNLYISSHQVKEKIEILGRLTPIDNHTFGNGPAHYYKIGGSLATVGFICPISCKFCLHCNRLRLTSDGLLMPCLVSNKGLDLKGPLRQGKEEEVLRLIEKAILLKPQDHNMAFSSKGTHLMSWIGG